MTVPILTAGSAPKKKKLSGPARKVEVAGQVTAGSVGSVFGAAKLRDEFMKDPKIKAEHKAMFTRAIRQGKQKAVQLGVKPATATRVATSLRTGHPGFRPLAVVVGGASVATAAHRHQQLKAAFARRRAAASDWAGGKSAPGRVVLGDTLKTSPLTKGNTMISAFGVEHVELSKVDIPAGLIRLGERAKPVATNLGARATNLARRVPGAAGNAYDTTLRAVVNNPGKAELAAGGVLAGGATSLLAVNHKDKKQAQTQFPLVNGEDGVSKTYLEAKAIFTEAVAKSASKDPRRHVAGPMARVADLNTRRFGRIADRKTAKGDEAGAKKNRRLAAMSRKEAETFRQIRAEKKAKP